MIAIKNYQGLDRNLFENFNKERFETMVNQKESLLLIHTFLEYLYEDVEGLNSKSQLDEYRERILKIAHDNPCYDRSQKVLLQDLVKSTDVQIQIKNDFEESINFYEKFIYDFLELTTQNMKKVLAENA